MTVRMPHRNVFNRIALNRIAFNCIAFNRNHGAVDVVQNGAGIEKI